MAASSLAEYGEVIRVSTSQDHEVLKRDGYAFISEAKPLLARQYCREMTLARGRILYEVWDHWTNHFMGYTVPEKVLQEAKAYSSLGTVRSYGGSASTHAPLRHAHNLVTLHFPRMPSYSVQMVAEDVLHSTRKRSITKSMVEDCAVLHAKWKYTSLEYRLSDMTQREADTLNTIKPRMREVLKSWLPHYVQIYDMIELWKRHGLLDADDSKEGGGRDEDLVFRRPLLTYYGGMELPSNLTTLCRARL